MYLASGWFEIQNVCNINSVKKQKKKILGFVQIGSSFNYNIKMNQDIKVNDVFKNNLHKMKAQNYAIQVYKN